MHMPELFLSVPVKASLIAGGKSYRAKTPAFSISTPASGISGETVRIQEFGEGGRVDFFEFTPSTEVDVEGKIVVVDGFGGPPIRFGTSRIRARKARSSSTRVSTSIGAFVRRFGARPTWTTISGSRPFRWSRSIDRMAKNLLARLASGAVEVTLHAELKEGWFECPCLVAEIKGNVEPERFVAGARACRFLGCRHRR